MCGIVGIVSRPPSRPTPTADEIVGGLDTALARRGDPARSPTRPAVVDAAPPRPAGRARPRRSPRPRRGDHRPPRPTRRLRRRGRRRARRRRAGPRRRRPRGGQRGVDRAPRRAVGDPARPAPHGPRGRRPRRPGRRPGRARRLPRDPAGAVGDRPHGGARSRLRRASTSSSGTTISTPPTRRSPPRSPTRAADPLFVNGSARLVGGRLSIVYKAAAEIGELGDNTRALRRAMSADGLLRLALAGVQAPSCRSSATPAGPAWASSPSPTPTP